jgi:glycosyltransferase involved in cell wall biosynthesis
MNHVSIIIPTHNRASMLRQAIESAKRAGDNVEVIVVDDASTDETASMCRELTGIVFVRLDRNVGLSQARNVGISKSTGEFLGFLDDDDLRIPGSIDKQARLLAQNEEWSFVYGQVQIGDAEHCLPTGDIKPAHCPTGDLFWELVKCCFIYVPSVLVRKRHLEKVGLFDPNISTTQDWDLWVRLTATHDVGALEEPVAIYRAHTRTSKQMSSNLPRMSKSGAYTVMKALNSPRGQEAEPEKREKIWSDYVNGVWQDLIVEGRYALSNGYLRYAARNYITAIQLNPARAFRLGAIASFVRDLIKANPNRTLQ